MSSGYRRLIGLLVLVIIVDLATIDPTSEETERTSTTMVTSLVEAYQSNVRSSLNSSMDSRESVTSKAEEQWPVLAMFKNLENLPGPLKQFWILYRYDSVTICPYMEHNPTKTRSWLKYVFL